MNNSTKFQKQLIALGACSEAREWVGKRTLAKAWAECVRKDWLYWLVTAPARKAYREATAAAWKAYCEATAPAQKAYNEAIAAAGEAYREATAAAWEAREAASTADEYRALVKCPNL